MVTFFYCRLYNNESQFFSITGGGGICDCLLNRIVISVCVCVHVNKITKSYYYYYYYYTHLKTLCVRLCAKFAWLL